MVILLKVSNCLLIVIKWGQKRKQKQFNKAPNHKHKVSIAKIASEKYNVMIVPQTLQNLFHVGHKKIMPPGS
jgi:hypothetical protein